jgi:membrane protease YdiL (CAAX protease family)
MTAEGPMEQRDVRPPAHRSRGRRLLEVTAFVAVLVAIGLVLAPSLTTYVLLTLPATVLFQLLARRRPLRELWVRGGPPMDRRAVTVPLAVGLAVVPVVTLVRSLDAADEVVYCLAAVVGAVAAGYAVKQGDRQTLRDLGLCLATAGVVGVGFDVLAALGPELATRTATGATAAALHPGLAVFVESLLLYVPVTFVMEEVTFRGLLDSHLHEPGERHALLTAVYISLLWGLWHIPTTPATEPMLTRIVSVIPMQLCVGMLLSLWWRRSGNLAVPGVTHAVIDAVRNSLDVAP